MNKTNSLIGLGTFLCILFAIFGYYGITQMNMLENDSDLKKCIRTGCYGQVCSNKKVITQCIWECEYSCYWNYADCEEVDNVCVWKEQPGFDKCMKKC